MNTNFKVDNNSNSSIFNYASPPSTSVIKKVPPPTPMSVKKVQRSILGVVSINVPSTPLNDTNRITQLLASIFATAWKNPKGMSRIRNLSPMRKISFADSPKKPDSKVSLASESQKKSDASENSPKKPESKGSAQSSSKIQEKSDAYELKRTWKQHKSKVKENDENKGVSRCQKEQYKMQEIASIMNITVLSSHDFSFKHEKLHLFQQTYQISRLKVLGQNQIVYEFTEQKTIIINSETLNMQLDVLVKRTVPLETPGHEDEHGKALVLACQVYKAIGLPTPKIRYISSDGKLCLVERMRKNVSCAAWGNGQNIEAVMKSDPKAKKLLEFAQKWLTVAAVQGEALLKLEQEEIKKEEGSPSKTPEHEFDKLLRETSKRVAFGKEVLPDFYPRNVMEGKDGELYFVDPSLPGSNEWKPNLYGFLIAWSNQNQSAFDLYTSKFPPLTKDYMTNTLAEEMAANGGKFPVSESTVK